MCRPPSLTPPLPISVSLLALAGRPGQQLHVAGARHGISFISRLESIPLRILLPLPSRAVQVACLPSHDVCTQVVACGTMQLAVFEAARASASAAARALHALVRSRLLSALESES